MELSQHFIDLAQPFGPDGYKEVRFGQRSFTCVDAYHIVERLTEVFGLCGRGWGFDSLDFMEYEKFVSCQGAIWYRLASDATDSIADWPVYYVHASGDGRIQGDNVPEARKMAQTNMLSKASSFLGVGLGVYKGMGHDDPYLASQASSPVVTQDAPPKIEPGDVKPISAKRAQQLTAIGVAAFGEGWPDARLPMVLAVTKKRTVTIDDLSGDECERMIAAIKCNQAGSAKYGAEWGAKRTNWLGTQNVTDVVELSQVRIEQAISKLEAP